MFKKNKKKKDMLNRIEKGQLSRTADTIKVGEKADELTKFLRDRLSEDDFKRFAILFKELAVLNYAGVKVTIEEALEL